MLPAIPVVTRRFLDGPIRQLCHEAFPSGIVIPLAGILGAGVAESRCKLERVEDVGVTDFGVVYGSSAEKLSMKKLMSSAIEPAVSG